MEENKMKINPNARTIALSKREATTAFRVGTPEYKQLQNARRDYPGFAVKVTSRKVTTQRETFKGLTYKYMEKYITAHDDDKKSIMAEYNMYRGKSEDPAALLPEPYTYHEMKVWFLDKFEAVAKFYENKN